MLWTHTLDSLQGRAVNPATNATWFNLVRETVTIHRIVPECSWGTDKIGFNPALVEKQRAIGHRSWKILYQQRNGV